MLVISSARVLGKFSKLNDKDVVPSEMCTDKTLTFESQ